MISKYLEKKIELSSDNNLLENNCPFELEYYLVESEINDAEDFQAGTAYGIEIVKKMGSVEVEHGLVRNFSFCRENARQILDILASNSVTPVSLPFILDDILGN